ncbi:hypothetical protein BH11PSE11_BH11PSE11_36570 [soil metagenome]
MKPRTWVGYCLALLLVCGASSHAETPRSSTPNPKRPVLVYTDIVSGPNTGGENNKGIYLSLFGKNFGNGPTGQNVKVLIGGVEVDNYRSLGASRGRKDIQQLTVQIGAIGKPKPGVPLPIKVVVNNLESNDDLTFTVNPGRILFVDNLKGNDLTAVVGDIAQPFRHVQTERLSEGAWGAVEPGDFIVLRGSGVPWTDRGFQDYFLRVRDKSGTAPTGLPGSGPISVMGYPGEEVFIDQSYDPASASSRSKGGISAVNGQSFPGLGQWITISNLRIEAGGPNGAINIQIKSSQWRIVNNELSAASAVHNPAAKAGGIAGNGFAQVWLGNRIHDVFCGPAGTGPLQNHGIYIDGDGEYEIAYNLIENIPGGSGFQTYVDGSNGSSTTNKISFHHNMIRGTGKHGINLADGTRDGIRIYNNIVLDTQVAGLRFNTIHLRLARIYNNTFYNTNLSGNQKYGAIMNDWSLPKDALDMQNNIFVPSSGSRYAAGSVGFDSKFGTIYRNFWFGGKGETSFDSYPQTGPLNFVVDGRDFHLGSGSWAIDAGSPAVSRLVINDYDITTRRPQGLGFDIGAFERPR